MSISNDSVSNYFVSIDFVLNRPRGCVVTARAGNQKVAG